MVLGIHVCFITRCKSCPTQHVFVTFNEENVCTYAFYHDTVEGMADVLFTLCVG